MLRAAATLLVVTTIAGAAAGRADGPPVPIRPDVPRGDGLSPALRLDPEAFFDLIVARYRHLAQYSDEVHLTQTYTRAGERSTQVNTDLHCEVDGAGLRVITPGRQAAGALGLTAPFRRSPAVERMRLQYDLWLAPHLALRFADRPLEEFRAGVRERFAATTAEAVTIEEKPMVHVTLEAGGDDDEPARATFDLYVNAESMLIERIEGEQTLDDGTSLTTTVEITSIQAEEGQASGEPAVEPAPTAPGPTPTPIDPSPLPVLEEPVPPPAVPDGPPVGRP